jgi:hypothetical protein
MTLREALFGLMMLSIGALAATAHYERKIADYRVIAEESYHEGEGDGYATAWYQFTGKPRPKK